MLSFKLFLETDKKSKEIPEWFYVAINLSSDLITGPSKSAYKGTIVTLNNVEGITENENLLKSSFDTGVVLKMPGKETLELNKLSRVQYDNPDYLMSKGLRALKRIGSGPTENGRKIYGYINSIISKIFSNLSKIYKRYFLFYEYENLLKSKDFEDEMMNSSNHPEIKRTTISVSNFSKIIAKDKIKEIKEINNVKEFGKLILETIKFYSPSFYNEMKKDKFVKFHEAILKSTNNLGINADEEEWVTKRQPKKINIEDKEKVFHVNQLHVPTGSIIYFNAEQLHDRYERYQKGQTNSSNNKFGGTINNLLNLPENFTIDELKERLKNTFKDNFIVHFIKPNNELIHPMDYKDFNLEDFDIANQISSILKKYKEISLFAFYNLCKKQGLNNLNISKYLKILEFNKVISIKDQKIKVLDKIRKFDKQQFVKNNIKKYIQKTLLNPAKESIEEVKLQNIKNDLEELSDVSQDELILIINGMLKDGEIINSLNNLYVKFDDVNDELKKEVATLINNKSDGGSWSFLDFKDRLGTTDSVELKKVLINLVIEKELVKNNNGMFYKILKRPSLMLKNIINIIKSKKSITRKILVEKIKKIDPSYTNQSLLGDLDRLLATGQIIKDDNTFHYFDEKNKNEFKVKDDLDVKNIKGILTNRFIPTLNIACKITGLINCIDILNKMVKDNLVIFDQEAERYVPADKVGQLKIEDTFEFRKIKDYFKTNPEGYLAVSDLMTKFKMETLHVNKLVKKVIEKMPELKRLKSSSVGEYISIAENPKGILDDKIKKFVLNLIKNSSMNYSDLLNKIRGKFPARLRVAEIIHDMMVTDKTIKYSSYNQKIIKAEVDEQELINTFKEKIKNIINEKGFAAVAELMSLDDNKDYVNYGLSGILNDNAIMPLYDVTERYPRVYFSLNPSFDVYKNVLETFLNKIKDILTNKNANLFCYAFIQNEHVPVDNAFLGLNDINENLCVSERDFIKLILELVKLNKLYKVKHELFNFEIFYALSPITWKEDQILMTDIKSSLFGQAMDVKNLLKHLTYNSERYPSNFYSEAFYNVSIFKMFLDELVEKGILNKTDEEKYYFKKST